MIVLEIRESVVSIVADVDSVAHSQEDFTKRVPLRYSFGVKYCAAVIFLHLSHLQLELSSNQIFLSPHVVKVTHDEVISDVSLEVDYALCVIRCVIFLGVMYRWFSSHTLVSDLT